MVLGVTGGIGCGKSTATGMFAGAGFQTIDSDALVRNRVLAEPGVISSAFDRWGATVLDGEGRLDRAKLAALVFADPGEREWWEALVHPRVYAHWRSILSEHPKGEWAIEVPLLFEKQLEIWFDFVVCVASSEASQLARLEQRGFTRLLAEQRISTQLSLATKVHLSDMVLWNDGSVDFLQQQVDRLVSAVRAHS